MAETSTSSLWTDWEDAVDALEEIDRALALGLPEDLTDWFTVNDLWTAIAQKHLADGERDGACHTAMAFYRLRAAGAVYADLKAGPDAKLVRPPGMSWSDYARTLAAATGLRMPSATIGMLGCVALLFVAAVGIAAWVGLLGPAGGFALGSSALLIALAAPRTWDKGTLTLGALSKKVAAMNLAELVNRGGRLRRDELWDGMIAVLGETAGIDPKLIATETRFFPLAAPRRRWL